MKLLQKRRSRSKHAYRVKLVADDFRRVRILYRVTDFRDDAVDVCDWTTKSWGVYADRVQTDALREMA